MPRARLDNSASPAERGDPDADLLRRNWLAASSVLVLGAWLRLYGLNLPSAWADEITTLVITDPVPTFGQFWQLVIADVHPPGANPSQPRQFALTIAVRSWWLCGLRKSRIR